MSRVILHSDLNSFYASVETMLDPSLRDRAVAVCGCVEERHGIVLAKSEKAKRAGVKTGMANWQAKQLCPDLITVPPQYDQYLKYSRLVRDIYSRYTDRIEPFGMDECWLDVTASHALSGTGENIAQAIRRTVREETGLTVSIGVSFNKIFAKLGSDMKKPDAVTVLPPQDWKSRVWPLPVSDLLYVGPSRTRRLSRRAIYTIGDLAAVDPDLLHRWFGVVGLQLSRYARGEDTGEVLPQGFVYPVKSLSHGVTCSRDLRSMEEVWQVMLSLSQEVGHRLRAHGLAAREAQLAIRGGDTLNGAMWSSRLPCPTQSPLELAQDARLLFARGWSWDEPVRAVCVGAGRLVPRDQPWQQDMFSNAETHLARHRVDDAVDAIRSRFGRNAILPASVLAPLPIPDDGRDLVKMPHCISG